MKALCIKQPWVEHILSGKKTIEIRSRHTHFRGKFLIACSKVPKSEYGGYIVAVAELVNSRPMQPTDSSKSLVQWQFHLNAWELENIKKIVPLPIKGKLGLFESGYTEEDIVYE